MTIKLAPVYDNFLDYLVEKAMPQEILAYRPPDAAQHRAEELTARNKAGTLSSEEAAELEQMLEFDLLVSALKSKALKALKKS